MSNHDYDDYENIFPEEDLSPEVTALIDKFKQLKRLYNTDIFDILIADGFADYEDIGHLIIDAMILTPDDREDLIQVIYDVFKAEEIYE